MTCRRIIACLDVKEGKTVKGVNFGDLQNAGCPASQAFEYQEQGADEIVMLDISASREDRRVMAPWVGMVASRLSIPLTAGGGVDSLGDAELLLNSGADRVTVNTAAVANPDLISGIARRFGSQCCVAAVDARRRGDSWTVLVRGGTVDTGMDLVRWVKEVCRLGAGEILLTSWDRDGTAKGFDLRMIREVADSVSVPVVASGGAGNPGHFTSLFRNTAADAALAAGILHRKETTVGRIKSRLMNDGIEVRPC